MSELLQNWLNNDVGLSTNVSNFERDFANGYLFGEILHKFKQQDDFDLFRNKNTYEAKIANFKRLEPTFKALGIKFNATQSNGMMNGERGAALRLLYQLKMASERLLLASDAAGAQTQNGRTQGQAAPPGGGVTKGIRVPRDQFDSHERRFFEHRLRATCLNVKQARMDKVTKKYDQERQKQELLAFEMENIEQARVAEQREIHRFGMRERLWQNRGAKDEWNAMSMDMWRKNMQVKSERENQDVHFGNSVVKKQQERLDRTRLAATAEVVDGVEAFEESLAGLGFLQRPEGACDADSDDDDEASEGSDHPQGERLVGMTTHVANARELVDALQSRMPNAQELEQEAGLFLRKIKESKRAGSIARKERERRRRRVLVEQQREQELLEEGKLEEVLLEKLGRESVEEKSISHSTWTTQRYEDVILKNRLVRQQGYAGRKKLDQREALHRDQDLLQEMLETMREQEARERVRYRAVERGRRARQRAQLLEECEGILELISAMAFAGLHEEQLTDDSDIDSTAWREWTWLFVESLSVPGPSSLAVSVATMYPLSATPPEPDLSDTGVVLNSAGLREYVEIRGQWQIQEVAATDRAAADHAGSGNSTATHSQADQRAATCTANRAFNPATEVVKLIHEHEPPLSFADRLSRELDVVEGRPVNYRLGTLVGALLDRAHKQEPLPQPPCMPQVPLRLVLTGKPFAGKRTLAARLSETYNLHVVDVDEVVRECLTLSKRPDLPTTRPVDIMSFTAELMDEQCKQCEEEGNPYVRHLQTIGFELQRRLQEGEAIDDELYVRMLTTKIRSLFPERLASTRRAHPAAAAATAAPSPRDGGAALTSGLVGACAGVVDRPYSASSHGGADETSWVNGASPASERTPAAAVDSMAPSEVVGDSPSPDHPRDSIASHALPGVNPEASSWQTDVQIEPAGWILIGFPDNRGQFALFERFLSGWVEPSAKPLPEAEAQKEKAAILAPRPPEDPPPFELTPGGYDLHIRLDVNANEVIRRAVGRRLDPATSLSYHLEDHPPTSKHQVIFERLVPVDELSSSMGSLTQRIHCFDTSQPEMEFFLSYFGPFADFPRLICIDANKTMEEVYDALDEQAAMLLQRKRARDAAEGEAAPAEVRLVEATDAAGSDVHVGTGEINQAGAPQDQPLKAVALSELPEYVDRLEGSLYDLLLKEWLGLHHNFVADLNQLFRWHRAHLSDFKSGLHGIHQRFIEYLQRPDDKQSLVDRFVMRFNSFSEEYPEMRKQDLTKNELHQRADDLQHLLQEHVENSRAAHMAQLEAIEKSQWVECQVEVLAAQAQHAVQLEARRYHATCQLLSDFYFASMGVALPPAKDTPAKIDALAQEEEPPQAASTAADPKKKSKEKAKREEDTKMETSSQGQGSQRICRYVDVTADADNANSRTSGHWEFPFLDSLMMQAQGALWSISEYKPIAAEKPEHEQQPKPKAKGRASPPPDKKGKVTEEVAPQLAPPAPPLYVDLQQALLAERVAYTHRLSVIRHWAERRLTAMNEAALAAYALFHDWVTLRNQKELAAVAGLLEVIKEHIESEATIQARLTLQGSHLHRHPNVRLQAPTVKTVPPPLEASAPWRWTMKQLHGLLDTLAKAAHSLSPEARTIPTRTLMTLLAQLAQPTEREDAAAKEEPQVPQDWQACDVERLQQLCCLFDHPPCTGNVDCVEFLLHIGLLHSPAGWPSLETLLKVRRCLEPQVQRGSSWPDVWMSSEALARMPLFDDAEHAEAAFSATFRPPSSSDPTPFNRSREQLLWIGRVLQEFPAPLRQWQAWELEVAWHDHQMRCIEDAERSSEMFDDMKSLLSDSPRPVADSMMPLLTPPPQADAAAAGSSGGEVPRPLPPRPRPPKGLPEPRSHGGGKMMSVRQLLAYLCQGASPEDGVGRALSVLGPAVTGQNTLVPAMDLHAVLVQLGARPLPPPLAGDGRPCHPSLEQLCEELELNAGGARTKAALRVADLGSSERVQRVLAKTGLGRRHCRVDVEKLFPKREGLG